MQKRVPQRYLLPSEKIGVENEIGKARYFWYVSFRNSVAKVAEYRKNVCYWRFSTSQREYRKKTFESIGSIFSTKPNDNFVVYSTKKTVKCTCPEIQTSDQLSQSFFVRLTARQREILARKFTKGD